MKKIQAFSLAALAATGVFLTGNASAQGAEPSCAQVICLSPAPMTPAPMQACPMIRAVYFAMQVWNPYYNSSATSEMRNAYLMTCTTATQQDLQTISDKYGELMIDPIIY